jgi:transcriptional regulator with XRE-family HTH domain
MCSLCDLASLQLCSGFMVGTGRRGRRKGVAVRVGSVADARKEAGLTLAEVARGKLSRTAIHLIEKGRARPSMETLEHIAEQTRKPLSFFVEAPESVSPLRAQDRLQMAKRHLAEALALDDVTRVPRIQAKICIVLAQIEEWCNNQAKADELFEIAIRIQEQSGEPYQLLDAHMAYAEVLEARPDLAAAKQHWKLAAKIGKIVALGLKRDASPGEGDESVEARGA